jgi:hypothetical protein
MDPEPLTLDFYTKDDCPLCEEAWAALERALARVQDVPAQIRTRDIRSDTGWFETYKWLVPVVELEGRRLAIYRVNERLLAKTLRRAWRERTRAHSG